MDNTTRHMDDEPVTEKTVSRRALLRAGWVIPVIAATPLLNTASAMSTVNCDALLERRNMHRKNGDRDSYNDIQAKLDANGCPC
ncbi:MAG: hypothetical protein AAF564_03980 [Bacteroidota bacterium]